MRSALRKRPDGPACAAAALPPASARPGREHAPATVQAHASDVSAGSGR
ncbi:hypothetical protein [Streptomyces ureilyticus]|uniref:Uncharacterized protein n=1 Tax=Streptomyces ureilyticus TaxID=1775131 RepID=A0ABX0DWC8_9ACTN|nr:hypothetical protein [Streptomyces ureilyticus]NGO46206.1 hypothetical protein [Streptomyces ureilyticus]